MKVGDKPLVGTTPLAQPEAKNTTTTPAAPQKSSGWLAKTTRSAPPNVATATTTAAKPQATAAASATTAKPQLWVPPSSGQWTQDSHGVQSDPINIYVHGSLDQLKQALGKAGWTEAAANNKADNIKYLEHVPEHEGIALLNKVDGELSKGLQKLTGKKVDLQVKDPNEKTIDSMPVSNQTLDGKPNIAAFENNNNPLAGRDHLRIFDTGKVDGAGNHVYAIAASRDTGIKIDKNRPEQGFLNHAVESNTDLERNTVVSALESTNLIGETRQFKVPYGSAPAPATGAKPQDSQAYDLVLK